MYVYLNTFDFRIMNSENIFHRHLTLLLISFKLKKNNERKLFYFERKVYLKKLFSSSEIHNF